MKMHTRLLLMLLSLVAPLWLAGYDDAKLKPITVVGIVVDTGCYMVHDGIGQDHVGCATECARKGIPLAILDDSGKMYLPLGVNHKNPNTQLMPFIEKKVKVTGTSVERGGMSGIAIKTVEAAKAGEVAK
jgi:hypothetical protein